MFLSCVQEQCLQFGVIHMTLLLFSRITKNRLYSQAYEHYSQAGLYEQEKTEKGVR